MNSPEQINPTPKISLNCVTNVQRQAIVEFLLTESTAGKTKHGSILAAANLFSISRRTVHRIWQRARNNLDEGTFIDVSSRKPTRVGRKRVEIDLSRIPEILLRRRTNIRSLSKAMGEAKSTIHRRIKEGKIKSHSNTVKPYLTDENKKARLEYCLSMIDLGTGNNNSKFDSMCNYIHIDEKWFFMTKTMEKYYLIPTEMEPLRTCKSKRFITKIMFLAAVARPQFDSFGNEQFSGKIGIFPFTYKEPAKRNSKNRVAGTMETKPILSVTKDVYRSCLLEKVLPAIRDKWPRSSSNTPIIYIQQDNAKPHIDPYDAEFLAAATIDGFDIRLTFQPPNSPDLNVLDLGFFRAIQSLQHQEAPTTVDELVTAVEKSYHELTSKNFNHIFLTLQLCMNEVLKVRGGNDYKLPHIGKDALERDGNLPFQIDCDQVVVQEVLNEVITSE